MNLICCRGEKHVREEESQDFEDLKSGFSPRARIREVETLRGGGNPSSRTQKVYYLLIKYSWSFA